MTPTDTLREAVAEAVRPLLWERKASNIANAVNAVAKLIRRGAFNDQICAIIADTSRNGPDDGLTRIGFVSKMTVHIMDSSRPPISLMAAKSLAWQAYDEFRRDNNVKFGDAGWDWSGRGAREIAQEYVINYFEEAA